MVGWFFASSKWTATLHETGDVAIRLAQMKQNCAPEQVFFFLKKQTPPIIESWWGGKGRGDEFNKFLSPKKSVIYYLKAIILTGVIGMRHTGILVLAHLY